MVEKKLKDSDERFGLEFEVKKNTKNANRIGFSNTIFKVGEKVYVLSEKEHDSVIEQLNQVDEYKSRIKELEADINDEDLKGELQEKDAVIANLKARVDILGKEVRTCENYIMGRYGLKTKSMPLGNVKINFLSLSSETSFSTIIFSIPKSERTPIFIKIFFHSNGWVMT